MHLIWENVVKNLMQLWTGQYKGLDTGSEDYEILPSIWEAIGDASAQAGDTIPGQFGPRPPNVASDKLSWTADTRSFWFQYVGPVLLARRFTHRKYYTHFIALVHILRKCLQYEMPVSTVAEIRQGFIDWVKDYEVMYYQKDPHRLAMCPLTVHALLHVADSIEFIGPVWTCWAFSMERYCGSLQPAIRSRRYPYSSLNRFLVDQARLAHLKLTYPGLEDVLRLAPPPTQGGTSIIGYDTCVLLSPRHPLNLSRGLTDKILACLCTRYDVPLAHLRRVLPKTVQEWAKLRILPAGDTIRSSSLQAALEDRRDCTFVRYEQLVDIHARNHHIQAEYEGNTFYGQLQHIIVLEMPTGTFTSGETLILGVIQSCAVERHNHDLDLHYYSRLGATEVVDIQTIQCAVGRIRDRNEWAILDRSGELSRALYTEDSEELHVL
ncbi:hypothetical protein DICSQDRAFT_78704 [Dichomitus squalens LYAD-421 SS1]|uniref:uncharacterized protein n=1 Tax=Dichomitus squalens (strain LYAD-421) TaxID=732165 RepID=UPI000441356A|nr:uncharacterized protein DICSQDRAFT_78704 [Dichomitus squalens LYAD-421 SS1]EJF66331.1 hypothetical protein DICSQDRAFT_78704 [Dichomitus squalens LYAD-421 SS1]